MFYIISLFFCSTYIITYVNGGVVSFIDPCSPDDQACILASSIKAFPYLVSGISELGIQTSDPLIVKNVQALDGDLKLALHDIQVHGIKNCKLVNVERNTIQNSLILVAECPLDASGTYDASGKVLVVPIEGNGPFNIKTDNLRIKSMVKVDTIDKDGKKYWNIVYRDIDIEPVEKVFLNFENIYDGDNEKAEAVNKLLDQNWLELVTTLGKPIFQEVINNVIDTINTFLNNVPTNELEKA